MKLRNKKTGEIGEVGYLGDSDGKILVNNINDLDTIYEYDSLAEFNAEWEDYEEPKTEFYITAWGDIREYTTEEEKFAFKQKLEIGNYFETEEEAEKAVKKLRAWKVLKDMGFKIAGIRYRNNKNYVEWSISQKVRDDYYAVSAFNEALHLLFGGEE